MKKRAFALFLAVLMLFSLAACGGEPPATAPVTEETEPDYPKYDFALSPFIRLPDHTAIRADFADPSVCTDEEVEEAIFQVLLTYAEFLPETAERAIALYDRVSLAYYGYIDGEVADDLVETDAQIVVGQSTDSIVQTVLSDALLGAFVGETVTAEYLYPEDAYFSPHAGKKVVFEATVASLEYALVPPCDEEFVQRFAEMGIETVDDFKAQIRRDILKEKEEDKIAAVWDAFIAGVEILAYPEAPMQWYRDYYEKEYLSTAEEYGVTLEKYLDTFLQLTPQDYQAQKEEFARRSVKNDMELEQLARESEITLTEEAFLEGVKGYLASSGEDLTPEEFIAEHGEEVLRTNLIWDEAIRILVDNAIRIGSPEDVFCPAATEPQTEETRTLS